MNDILGNFGSTKTLQKDEPLTNVAMTEKSLNVWGGGIESNYSQQ